MACCILGALLIGQLLHIWQLRRARFVRVALFATLGVATLGMLAYQLHLHADHYLQPFLGRSTDDPIKAMLADPGQCCGDCIRLLALSRSTASTDSPLQASLPNVN